ncbi:MAG: WbqC family protein [Candidatus Omnitrophica bacterium]|nr:WbqC family protein [Candidatus Omnitrophota bacterium]
MICAIHQPQYLPWLGYFEKMSRADVFVLLDNVQFKKNEWQNRNRIRTSQGWQWLTVPVLHDHGQLICDVKFNSSRHWREDHVRAIELNYKKAPFFDVYWPRLRLIYEKDWKALGELNIALVTLLAEFLGIATEIKIASKLNVSSEKTQRLIDICRARHCDTYLAGAGCAEYMDFAAFKVAGIKVDVQSYNHPAYPQLWTGADVGFQPFMSVIDLLFNCGEKSKTVLLNQVAIKT